MRNDYIGTSIDGDARAACGSRNTAMSGYVHQARTNPCNSCGNERSSQGACNRCGNENCTCQNRSDNCGCNTCDNARSNKSTCSRCGKENCTCQNRSGDYGCNVCDNERSNKGYYNRSGDCGCNNNTPAMVYAAHHNLESIYCAEKALLRGTLFGCLDKPMCNERCMENPCATQCQEDKFTIWELRLYLNTHPCDQQALALMRKLTAQMDGDCGCAFNPDCSNRWTWTEGPWPWEFQHCCGKEA